MSVETLGCQFFFRVFALVQMRKAHPTEHPGRLCELQVVIFDDLNSISPRIEKVQKTAFENRGSGRLGELAYPAAIIDDQAEVATIVALLPAPLHERDELIAHVDESASGSAPSQLE